jgi:hypothetical protein
MDVEPDVIIQPDLGLTGMDAHAHAHVDVRRPALRGERLLRGHRGGDRVARPREGDEERVAIGVDHAAVVLVERSAQHTLMLD